MSKHEIFLSESELSSRRKMTAGEWLALTKMRGDGPSKVFDLPNPIKVVTVERDEHTLHETVCKTSLEFFGLLARLADSGEVIAAVLCEKWAVGPHGLYALNAAVRTFALRKGGRNVIRHWLQVVRQSYTPLRGEVLRLFQYLEIRPLSLSEIAPEKAGSIYYVYSLIKHNAEPAPGLTPAPDVVRRKTKV